jgi:hypothetical protein
MEWIMKNSVADADPGCLSRISDPNFPIPDPGSRIQGLKDPGSKNIWFLTQKTVYKLSDKLFGIFIPDPGSGSRFFRFGSRIRIRNTDKNPQS